MSDNHLTMTIDGVDYEAVVTRGHYFEITLGEDGDRVSSETWDGLEQRVKERLRRRKVKVAVEFVVAETGERGTAYGIHGGSGRVLVQWADGRREQFGTYGSGAVLAPDTDVERLQALREAVKRASNELRDFSEAHKLAAGDRFGGLKSAVEEAIARELQG